MPTFYYSASIIAPKFDRLRILALSSKSLEFGTDQYINGSTAKALPVYYPSMGKDCVEYIECNPETWGSRIQDAIANPKHLRSSKSLLIDLPYARTDLIKAVTSAIKIFKTSKANYPISTMITIDIKDLCQSDYRQAIEEYLSLDELSIKTLCLTDRHPNSALVENEKEELAKFMESYSVNAENVLLEIQNPSNLVGDSKKQQEDFLSISYKNAKAKTITIRSAGFLKQEDAYPISDEMCSTLTKEMPATLMYLFFKGFELSLKNEEAFYLTAEKNEALSLQEIFSTDNWRSKQKQYPKIGIAKERLLSKDVYEKQYNELEESITKLENFFTCSNAMRGEFLNSQLGDLISKIPNDFFTRIFYNFEDLTTHYYPSLEKITMLSEKFFQLIFGLSAGAFYFLNAKSPGFNNLLRSKMSTEISMNEKSFTEKEQLIIKLVRISEKTTRLIFPVKFYQKIDETLGEDSKIVLYCHLLQRVMAISHHSCQEDELLEIVRTFMTYETIFQKQVDLGNKNKPYTEKLKKYIRDAVRAILLGNHFVRNLYTFKKLKETQNFSEEEENAFKVRLVNAFLNCDVPKELSALIFLKNTLEELLKTAENENNIKVIESLYAKLTILTKVSLETIGPMNLGRTGERNKEDAERLCLALSKLEKARLKFINEPYDMSTRFALIKMAINIKIKGGIKDKYKENALLSLSASTSFNDMCLRADEALSSIKDKSYETEELRYLLTALFDVEPTRLCNNTLTLTQVVQNDTAPRASAPLLEEDGVPSDESKTIAQNRNSFFYSAVINIDSQMKELSYSPVTAENIDPVISEVDQHNNAASERITQNISNAPTQIITPNVNNSSQIDNVADEEHDEKNFWEYLFPFSLKC